MAERYNAFENGRNLEKIAADTAAILIAIGGVSSNDLEGLGAVTVGTSEVEVAFTGTTEKILISAEPANTGIVFVGKTGVLSDGSNHVAKLWAGDDLILDYEDSSNAIYLISDTAAQTVSLGATL